MSLMRDELVAIEDAVVRGWPALEAERIDGWLARWSSGGSVRANTVATVRFAGGDIDDALARVVQFYRERGGVPKFTITDVTEPVGLDAELDRRGWRRSDDHVTMIKAVASGPASVPLPFARRVEIVATDRPTKAWQDVYLQGLSENRRAVALRLVEGTPTPRKFVLACRDGAAIASGLTVLDGPLASVQCMAARSADRRTGAASAVLAAIEAIAAGNDARRLYLQTDDANIAAVCLYSRTGFMLAGRYHTRELGS